MKQFSSGMFSAFPQANAAATSREPQPNQSPSAVDLARDRARQVMEQAAQQQAQAQAHVAQIAALQQVQALAATAQAQVQAAAQAQVQAAAQAQVQAAAQAQLQAQAHTAAASLPVTSFPSGTHAHPSQLPLNNQSDSTTSALAGHFGGLGSAVHALASMGQHPSTTPRQPWGAPPPLPASLSAEHSNMLLGASAEKLREQQQQQQLRSQLHQLGNIQASLGNNQFGFGDAGRAQPESSISLTPEQVLLGHQYANLQQFVHQQEAEKAKSAKMYELWHLNALSSPGRKSPRWVGDLARHPVNEHSQGLLGESPRLDAGPVREYLYKEYKEEAMRRSRSERRISIVCLAFCCICVNRKASPDGSRQAGEVRMEEVANILGADIQLRRRLYDVIASLESLNLISRCSKRSRFIWKGFEALPATTKRLREEALKEKRDGVPEGDGNATGQGDLDSPGGPELEDMDEDEVPLEENERGHSDIDGDDGSDDGGEMETPRSGRGNSDDTRPKITLAYGLRGGSSLASLTTRFVKILLTTESANMHQLANSLCVAVNHRFSNKNIQRRLYDVANLMEAIGLVKKTKKNFKHAYVWTGIEKNHLSSPEGRETLAATLSERFIIYGGMSVFPNVPIADKVREGVDNGSFYKIRRKLSPPGLSRLLSEQMEPFTKDTSTPREPAAEQLAKPGVSTKTSPRDDAAVAPTKEQARTASTEPGHMRTSPGMGALDLGERAISAVPEPEKAYRKREREASQAEHSDEKRPKEYESADQLVPDLMECTKADVDAAKSAMRSVAVNLVYKNEDFVNMLGSFTRRLGMSDGKTSNASQEVPTKHAIFTSLVETALAQESVRQRPPRNDAVSRVLPKVVLPRVPEIGQADSSVHSTKHHQRTGSIGLGGRTIARARHRLLSVASDIDRAITEKREDEFRVSLSKELHTSPMRKVVPVRQVETAEETNRPIQQIGRMRAGRSSGYVEPEEQTSRDDKDIVEEDGADEDNPLEERIVQQLHLMRKRKPLPRREASSETDSEGIADDDDDRDYDHETWGDSFEITQTATSDQEDEEYRPRRAKTTRDDTRNDYTGSKRSGGKQEALEGAFTCQFCHRQHDGTYGSNRFCNAQCARSYSAHQRTHPGRFRKKVGAVRANRDKQDRRKGIKKKALLRRKRKPEPSVCETCGQAHDGGYASGRFCSKACAKSFSCSQKVAVVGKARGAGSPSGTVRSSQQHSLAPGGPPLEAGAAHFPSGSLRKRARKKVYETAEAPPKSAKAAHTTRSTSSTLTPPQERDGERRSRKPSARLSEFITD